MIELLLEAERSLAVGRLDHAERLYRQAADGDPRNAIALVGLARISLERGDEDAALGFGERAVAIDPDNQAARRLVDRLVEVRAHRGSGGSMARAPEAGVEAGASAVAAADGPDVADDAGALDEPAPASPSRIARLRRWLLRR